MTWHAAFFFLPTISSYAPATLADHFKGDSRRHTAQPEPENMSVRRFRRCCHRLPSFLFSLSPRPHALHQLCSLPLLSLPLSSCETAITMGGRRLFLQPLPFLSAFALLSSLYDDRLCAYGATAITVYGRCERTVDSNNGARTSAYVDDDPVLLSLALFPSPQAPFALHFSRSLSVIVAAKNPETQKGEREALLSKETRDEADACATSKEQRLDCSFLIPFGSSVSVGQAGVLAEQSRSSECSTV